MNVWIQDADQVDFTDFSLSNVYRTKCVDNFLYSDKIFGIAAARGIGKTFLLKARRLIEQEKGGVECLPEDAMLATMAKPSIDSSAKNYLLNYDNWVAIWESTIFISVMSNLYHKEGLDINDLWKCPLHKKYILLGGSIEDVFCQICSQTKKFLYDLRGEYSACRSLFRLVHNGISIFIDRLDQAFATVFYIVEGQTLSNTGPSDPNYWKFVQISLAQASYRINAINSHIKVFFGIRKEAMSEASSLTREYVNFIGSIQEINYEKFELQNMFHAYIKRETPENLVYPEVKYTNPEYAFLGLTHISHQYLKGVKESVFEYIYRHTFGRPRDIMHICSNLYTALLGKSDINNDSWIRMIRHSINQGSLFLLENYIIELEPFFYQINRNTLNNLCKKLISNTLNKPIMDEVCYKLHRESEGENVLSFNDCIQGNHCIDCHGNHPFCQLYNIGLIGELYKVVGGDYEIRFRQYGGDAVFMHEHLMPPSKLYFLHPALSNKVAEIRRITNQKFERAKTLIGQGEILSKSKAISLNRRLNILRVENPSKKVFISSTCFDLGDIRAAIKRELEGKGFEVIISEDIRFNTNQGSLHTHDHCIEEMLKCDYVIFLVSGRYGGEYQGGKYSNMRNEIGRLNNNLVKPSISLMEFYVAKMENIPIIVFIDERVNYEKHIYSKQKDKENFNLTYVNDRRVFDVVTFLTKNINTWRQEYRNLENLLELINIALPN